MSNMDLFGPLPSFTCVNILGKCLYFLTPYPIWTSMTPMFSQKFGLCFFLFLPNKDLSGPLPSFTYVNVLDECRYFLTPYPIWTSVTPMFSKKFGLCFFNPCPIWTSLDLSLPLLVSMFLENVDTF